MEYNPQDETMKRIEKNVNLEISNDAMDLSVAHVHTSFAPEELVIRAVCRVLRIQVTVMKPASRWDVIKTIMPGFIRRRFPPKLKPVPYRIPFPAVRHNMTKDKLASLVYYTDELYEDKDALVEWCSLNITESLKHKINDNTVPGYWVPDEYQSEE